MDTKNARQAMLVEIVQSNSVKTQTELSKQLKRAGIACTQVSVSRDIRELGLIKKDGHYATPDKQADIPNLDTFAKAVSGFIKHAEIVGDNLVVVKTLPGTAHSVALLLDRIGWPGIKGTIAGDDTVFVAVQSHRAGKSITDNLRKLTKD
jgi:transcriptional regulator of arginine metabolism